MTEALVLKPDMFNFTLGTPVISDAQKFVVPVPTFADGGESLVYPEGHERAGQPITDWQNQPIGDTGIVFWNGKDNTWQAARNDGQSVVIINQATPDQARQLYEAFNHLGNLAQITVGGFKTFLDFARSLGLVDIYNSDVPFIAKNMTPVTGESLIQGAGTVFGFLKRDARDIAHAIFVGQPFIFEGPAATPQQFPQGGVLLQHGKDVRGIQPGIFQETYRLAEGGRAITDLTSQMMAFEQARA